MPYIPLSNSDSKPTPIDRRYAGECDPSQSLGLPAKYNQPAQYQLPRSIYHHNDSPTVNIPIMTSHNYSPLSGLLSAMNNLSIQTSAQPSLSLNAFNFSNTVATTDQSIPPAQLQTPADSSDDESTRSSAGTCAMVRKKSGEVVRPALRNKGRASSAPGTPTFNKNVHFDAKLEHIRHFMRLDKPTAVSADTSPTEHYGDGERTEFPFDLNKPRGDRVEWDANIVNFPAHPDDRPYAPVRLERVFPSSDNRSLIGVVYAANLAFQKHVVARFTLDYWKTTSEVIAEYKPEPRRRKRSCHSHHHHDDDTHHACSHDAPPHLQDTTYDRFDFTISLGDQPNLLQSRQLLTCIRYSVNGQEYWDNNDRMNYIINFSCRRSNQPPDGCSPLRDKKHGLPVPRSKRAVTFPRRKSHSTGMEKETELRSLERSPTATHDITLPDGDVDYDQGGNDISTPLPSPNTSPPPVLHNVSFKASHNSPNDDGDRERLVAPDEIVSPPLEPSSAKLNTTHSILEKAIQEKRSTFCLPSRPPIIPAFSHKRNPDKNITSPREDKSAFSTPATEVTPAVQRPSSTQGRGLPQLFGARYDFQTPSLAAPMENNKWTQKDDLSGVWLGPPQPQQSSLKDFGTRDTTSSDSRHPTELLSTNPNHKSAAYQEIVDRFCFYGSSKDAGPATSSATPHYNDIGSLHESRSTTTAPTAFTTTTAL